LTVEKSTFKQRLRSGAPQIGIRCQFCSPMVAEAIAWSGYQYVYIDMEHAPNDPMSVVQQCQAIAGTPAHPVVRLPTNNAVLIQQMLDAGIENLVVPMVETAKEAEAAVAAVRFPPAGIRSVARFHRGNRFGNMKDYETTTDERVCLVVQVETRAAIERISEIASVDGVDGVLFGPADLAADIGHLGDADHPDVLQMMSDAIPKIGAAGKFAGMSSGDPSSTQGWLAKGCHFISIGGDIPMLVSQARRAYAAALV
jgi:2-keto-3-deoxy-L-rhamnonate aldolase RhmA